MKFFSKFKRNWENIVMTLLCAVVRRFSHNYWQKLALICFVFMILIVQLDYYLLPKRAFDATVNGLSSFATANIDANDQLTFSRKMTIVEAMDPTLFETRIQLPSSHMLENSCKFPVLQNEDPNIQLYVKHVRQLTCNNVQPNYVYFQNSVLHINQHLALKLLNDSLVCTFRPFAGSLKPFITSVIFHEKSKNFTDRSPLIRADHVEVKCHLAKNDTREAYSNAFAQVGEHLNRGAKRIYRNTDESTLSVDIIGLDSTSLNMFRRHMPRTLTYFNDVMGGVHLEGYNKVSDNSMVNWIPTLTGLRYGNQSDDMPSDFETNGEPLVLETVPWIWKDFEEKGCVTAMNDDPMHYTRGLFHYPWTDAAGFQARPTHHYYRPWHVYHRRYVKNDTTYFCFNNEPYYKLQLQIVEDLMQKYRQTCRFSFSFFTDISHDDPSNLELMDDALAAFLERQFKKDNLNNTVLILMGDHGHRIAAIQYTYVGRIEERATYFGVYFPEWFRRKHPEIVENLKYNRYRLTSNYDVYQMLDDIVNGRFKLEKKSRRSPRKGISLFEKIPANRTCKDANIPEHHCLCMEPPLTDDALVENILEWSAKVIYEYVKQRLTLYPKCHNLLTVEIFNARALTTNQMVQHGVRHQLPEYLERLKVHERGLIEYFQMDYGLAPTNVTGLIRLQHDKNTKVLSVNVKPLFTGDVAQCNAWINLQHFCACASFLH